MTTQSFTNSSTLACTSQTDVKHTNYRYHASSAYCWALVHQDGVYNKPLMRCIHYSCSGARHTFYLTIEERDKVYNANLRNKPELEVYRDLFIFQSMVGCRVGDLFSFTKDNIVGDILQYLPHKTMRKRSQTVSVPLTTKAMEILKRYDGKQENFCRQSKCTNTTRASVQCFENVASTEWLLSLIPSQERRFRSQYVMSLQATWQDATLSATYTRK